MEFNPDFIRLLAETLGGEFTPLTAALDGEPPVSVRWNPYKTECAPDTVAGISAREPVLWGKYGRYLAERPSFTLDPWFHAGKYYVQEASSMFVEHIYRSVTGESATADDGAVAGGGVIAGERTAKGNGSATGEGVRILDLCAAPGGKTTLYSTLAGPGGLVVANEIIRGRAGILADNVRKWGLGNVVVTNNDPANFTALREWFDLVAVDAPCSGEGMFRKSPDARAEWSMDNVRLCAARQRRILADAWEVLRPGGVLIYSTCTFNRQENEENIAWLTENFDCADVGMEAPPQWNIAETEAAGIKCFRFFPHRVKGEGFFACAVRKGGQKGRPVNPKPRRQLFTDISGSSMSELRRWVNQPEYMRFAAIGDSVYGYYTATYHDVKSVSETLNAIHSGICMGQLFGGKLKPYHSLAMFHDLNTSAANITELSPQDAVKFLQKENLSDISALTEGLNIITCRDAPLGWAKRIGIRINNLYPKSLAITGWK